MTYRKFEDLEVWKKSKDFVRFIYEKFAPCRDLGFKDQIRRASISIINNIAEGFERNGNKEFKRFLFKAKGSCGEVRSMLYLARDLSYLSKIEFQKALDDAEEISKMLMGLIKKLN